MATAGSVKLGRPPLPEPVVLRQVLHVRVTDPVFDALDAEARRTGKTVCQVARETLVQGLSVILGQSGRANGIILDA